MNQSVADPEGWGGVRLVGSSPKTSLGNIPASQLRPWAGRNPRFKHNLITSCRTSCASLLRGAHMSATPMVRTRVGLDVNGSENGLAGTIQHPTHRPRAKTSSGQNHLSGWESQLRMCWLPWPPAERGRQPAHGAVAVISRCGCIHRNGNLLEESIASIDDLFCAFSIEVTPV